MPATQLKGKRDLGKSLDSLLMDIRQNGFQNHAITQVKVKLHREG